VERMDVVPEVAAHATPDSLEHTAKQ